MPGTERNQVRGKGKMKSNPILIYFYFGKKFLKSSKEETRQQECNIDCCVVGMWYLTLGVEKKEEKEEYGIAF